jgi:hypothetical protein
VETMANSTVIFPKLIEMKKGELRCAHRLEQVAETPPLKWQIFEASQQGMRPLPPVCSS